MSKDSQSSHSTPKRSLVVVFGLGLLAGAGIAWLISQFSPTYLIAFLTRPEVRLVTAVLAPPGGALVALANPRISASVFGKKGRPSSRVIASYLLGLVLIVSGPVTSFLAFASVDSAARPDLATTIRDLTVFDDEEHQPGDPLRKRWELFNAGNTVWTKYEARLTNFGFEESVWPNAPRGFMIQQTPSKANQTVEVDLAAPSQPGCYKAIYKLFNGSQLFGDPFTIAVFVADPSGKQHNFARFVKDLSVYDLSLINRRETFHKGWLLHNCGSNSWHGYVARRVSGFGPDTISVPDTGPHQDVAIWQDFVAPDVLSKRLEAVYQLEDDQHQPFGAMFSLVIKTDPAP